MQLEQEGRVKAYKLTVLVIDFDGLGSKDVAHAIEDARYANDCVSPSVVSIEERDIGEWHDDHPLNKHATAENEFHRLFGGSA